MGFMWGKLGIESGFSSNGTVTSTTATKKNEKTKSEVFVNNNSKAIDALAVYRLGNVGRLSANLKAGVSYVMSDYQIIDRKKGKEKSTQKRLK